MRETELELELEPEPERVRESNGERDGYAWISDDAAPYSNVQSEHN